MSEAILALNRADRHREELAATRANLAALLDLVGRAHRTSTSGPAWDDLCGKAAEIVGVDHVALLRRENGRRRLLSAGRAGGGPSSTKIQPSRAFEAGRGRTVEIELEEEGFVLFVEPGHLSPAQREWLSALGGQLAHAWRAAVARHEAERRTRLLLAALDRISAAVLLVGPRAKLEHANEAGRDLLARRSGLECRNGQVRAIGRTPCAELAALLGSGGECGDERPPPLPAPCQAIVRVPMPGRGAPLHLLVVPLATAAGSASASEHMIVAADDTGGSAALSPALRRLLGLTEREAEVVAQLLCGRGLAEAAKALGVARETARSHFKSVCAKLGSNRQADLVRLLLAGPSFVRWD